MQADTNPSEKGGPGRAASSPTALLFAARALRDFGDGFAAVLLPVYLLALGCDAFQVGVLATVSLFGSALLTLVVGMLGSRFDHRPLLLGAACLAIATGVAFAVVHDFALLLVVAFAGTINPSGGSASVFTPLEHAVLAREAQAADRTRTFARYSLAGALAGAVGSLAAAAPDLLTALGVERLAALKAMFVFYAALALVGGAIYARLPRRPPPAATGPAVGLGPSRGIVLKLAALFSLDSFGGGFVVQSLLALWLFERFELSLSAAAGFFFWSGVLAAFSFPVAAWIARRIGLINTMVYTHIPANLALMAAPFVADLWLVLALLLFRAALSQMDVPTRSSYVMAVVTEAERAAAASVTAVPRSLATAASPALAGALFEAGHVALPFVLGGGLKLAYDLLLLAQFRHHKPPEERG
ncbi:MAG: MFS transporter [Alphaproteobacteria bacterium]|nr:MFS transporter [Alphaproteobacteria bacterium]